MDKTERNYDAEWRELSRESMKHIRNGDFGLYRNARFNMSQIVAKEGKYENAVSLLCEVVFWDLSCLGNGDKGFTSRSPKQFRQALSLWCMHGINFVMAPRVRVDLLSYQKKLGWTDGEFWDFVVQSFDNLSAPFHPFEKSECVQILKYYLTDNEKAIAKMTKAAEKRLIKELKKYV